MFRKLVIAEVLISLLALLILQSPSSASTGSIEQNASKGMMVEVQKQDTDLLNNDQQPVVKLSKGVQLFVNKTASGGNYSITFNGKTYLIASADVATVKGTNSSETKKYVELNPGNVLINESGQISLETLKTIDLPYKIDRDGSKNVILGNHQYSIKKIQKDENKESLSNSAGTKGQWIKVISKNVFLLNHNKGQPVLELSPGVELFGIKREDGSFEIKWNNQEYYIDKKGIQLEKNNSKSPDEQSFHEFKANTLLISNEDPLVSIHVLQTTSLPVSHMNSGKIVASIGQINYSVSQSKESNTIKTRMNSSSQQNNKSAVSHSTRLNKGKDTSHNVSIESMSKAHFQAGDRFFKVTKDKLPVYNKDKKRILGYLRKDQVYARIKGYGDWHEVQFGNQHGFVWTKRTISANGELLNSLSNRKEPKRLTITLKTNASVYDNDNKSGDLVRFATLPAGEKYPVISSYGNWWRVAVAGRIGYVYKGNATKNFQSNDHFFKVTAGHLPVFSKGKDRILGFLEKGQAYPRVSGYGDWHQIRFENQYGYVWKEDTIPASSNQINDLSKGKKIIKGRQILAEQDMPVYSKGKKSRIATLVKGEKYPLISDYGHWWRISVAGRIGYVHKGKVKLSFSPSDHYFRAISGKVPVYSKGKANLLGYLMNGKEYKRISNFGSHWLLIQFGNHYGYVWKRDTALSSGNSIKKTISHGTGIGTFTAKRNVEVVDNSSGHLIPFAVISKGEKYTILKDYGNWLKISFAGRIGYVYKNYASNIHFTKKYKNIVNPHQVYTYKDMQADIQELKKTYPGLVQTKIIGHSIDGRNLYAVKLGKGSKEIFLNGSHHAREYITTNLLMEMIDEYSADYVKGIKMSGYNVRSILNRVSIWFVPMVNPDGVTLVQKGYNSAKHPQQVLQLNGGSKDFSHWKANIRGVDLNRQYPADWAHIIYSSGHPSFKNYKGTAPLTEPEVKAIYNFTLKHHFLTDVAYHTSGRLIYWDFHQKKGNAQYNLDYHVAKMVQSKTGYPLFYPGPHPSGGGYTDWTLIHEKVPGLTIEVSPFVGPRPVPISHFNEIWKRNNTIGLMLAKEAANR